MMRDLVTRPNLNYKGVSHQKATFSAIFGFLVVLLMILPFVITFNEFLTTLVMKIPLYRAIQELLVPHLVRMVGVILSFLGIGVGVSGDTIYLAAGAKNVAAYISWNCVGWQSMLLLGLTLLTGLQGEHSFTSRLKTIILGFLGTFLVNVLRITIVAVFAFYFGRLPATIFHDYFSTLLIIVWFFFFWWFSYSFVLEGKQPS